ncbi:putative baseplate assembly protein, partial [Corallococcus sp. AB004]
RAELPPGTYLARDFESFSRLLLDRLRLTVTTWHERHTADLGVMLVEMMAHAGDLLSYHQDAAAAEAYLGTARRRGSLRRHARLLDYRLHEGCNARTWMALTLQEGVDALELPAGSKFYVTPRVSEPDPFDKRVHAANVTFESLAPARLSSKLNAIDVHLWGAEREVLPAGATSATLKGHFPELRSGDVLIFEELIDPVTGLRARAHITHRHAVRLTEPPGFDEDPLGGEQPQPLTRVKWSLEDALPFPLVFGHLPGGPLAQVLGNVVLADEGETRVQDVGVGNGLVVLPLRGLQVACAEQHDAFIARSLPATASLRQDPKRALPCVRVEELRDDFQAPHPVRHVPWEVREDLLSSGRFERHFVAELGDADAVVLRFGDGELGRRPRPGASLRVWWRYTLGLLGNVGPDTLGRWKAEGISWEIASVRNPLSAMGALPPEDSEQARRDAPQDFRTQERAVTEDDFNNLAQRLPEVRQAVTLHSWNGSTSVVRVHVLPRQGREPPPELLSRLQRYLTVHSLIGTDVEVRPPELVPLDILLRVGVQPGRALAHVRQALEQELGSGELAGGGLGFFHPSAFRLNQSAYLAPVVARAASVPGVTWVEPLRFQRWGQDASSALDSGRIALEPSEVVLVDGQPGRPDLGLVRFKLEASRS